MKTHLNIGMDKEWVTTDQAARLSGYSTAYMRQLAQRGRVTAIKVGRDWLINRAELLQFAREMEALGLEKHSPKRKHNQQEVQDVHGN